MFDQNQLLAALPAEDKARLSGKLELVPLPLGTVLYESGDVQQHIYFPVDAIVSLLYVLKDGASAEIAVVGHAGPSASRWSWVASAQQTGRSCRAPAMPTG